MTTPSHRATYFLLALALASVPCAADGRGVDDLLPPPVRRAEKRSLVTEQERQQSYSYRHGALGGASFSPDGKTLLAGNGWWDIRTGRNLDPVNVRFNYGEGVSFAFAPDGKQVVMASWGGHQGAHPVSVFDAVTRNRLRSLDEGVNDTPFTSLAVAPDGKTVAFGGGASQRGGGTPHVVFWDLTSGDQIGHLDGLTTQRAQNRVMVYRALAYSPDGRTLAALLGSRVVLFEVATGKPRGELAVPDAPEVPQNNQAQASGALAFSPDGRTLVVGCSDGAIRRYDLRTGLELTPLPGHATAVVALCWTPDGKRILSYSRDSELLACRPPSGREWSPKPGPLTADDLEGLWDVLRGGDARDVFGCVRTLAASPAQAMPFLRKHLLPVPQGDAQLIAGLVGDLQKDYNTRKRAVVQLRKIGRPAADALQQGMQRGMFDNVTRLLVFELSNLPPPPEEARAIRALGVLERIGGPDAAKLLGELAGGAPTAGLTTQAKAALARLPKAGGEKPEQTTATLWDALAASDSPVALRAIRALAGRPKAVALLRDRLKEAASKGEFDDDPKRVAKLIADLDSEDFEAREAATKGLLTLGRAVVPSLRKSLSPKVSAELKARLEKLIAEAAKGAPPEMLRAGRVLEALELAGTDEARQALEALAKEAKGVWLREAASASLRRQRVAKP